jgi:DNA-binding transcriptional MerR regulator
MRIGELSERIGISERALRYYEEQGLLRPSRRPSGYREYSEADAQTVRRIRTLLAAGLGTSVIAEVLPCVVDEGEIVAPACPELVPYLVQERDRITRSIDELRTTRAILDAIITATPPQGDPALECPPDGGVGVGEGSNPTTNGWPQPDDHPTGGCG